MTKYVKLYEDYQQDITKTTEDTSHTWTQLRDAIQTKLPFIIITFKNSESYSSALDSEILQGDYIKQTAAISRDGQMIDYPSIFMVLDDDEEFKDKIPQIFEKYKIKNLIFGKKGEEYVDYYYSDGTSSPAGNEIISSIDKDDMENDEHFKMGSTYYKFINFAD